MLNLLLPHPAALIKTEKTRTLLIADPHLGWENSLQEKGIHVPSQTQKILNKLISIITKYKPDKLVILGDVKYTVVSSELGEWQDIPDFFAKLQDHISDIAIVRGNHDANLEPLLPEKISLLPATGTVIGDVGVFHGHKWPSPAILGCKTLAMGHLHPVVVFRDPAGFKITRQVWMRAGCKAEALAKILLQKHGIKIEGSVAQTLQKHYNVKPKANELIIMPSFSDFLGGRPVNETKPRKEIGAEALIGPVLRSEAIDVDDAELYLLDGTYLGTLNQLRKL
ncbi:MAG: metallophosphoesterase [Candidatus Bathyarchaeota archaeon]|nr:metallophosphoesterase [Candidatus Bathyarchaeota archaeon]